MRPPKIHNLTLFRKQLLGQQSTINYYKYIKYAPKRSYRRLPKISTQSLRTAGSTHLCKSAHAPKVLNMPTFRPCLPPKLPHISKHIVPPKQSL